MQSWEKEISIQCVKDFSIMIGVSLVGGFALAAVGATAIKSLIEADDKDSKNHCIVENTKSNPIKLTLQK